MIDNHETIAAAMACVTNRQLGMAITQLENYLLTRPQPRIMEQLMLLKSDYGLMTNYWLDGFSDPQRDRLYDQLLKRMYVLTTDAAISNYQRKNTFVEGVYNRVRSERKNWSVSGLKSDLETYVTEMAVLELEPEHTRQQKQLTICQEHERLMARLFDYIWTSRSWRDDVATAFTDMLLTPTIDSTDQQLLVSAITVASLNFFDFNKFRLLTKVYTQAADERVRQRALIGWVLSLDADAASLYSEVHETVKAITADERCCDELAELQMQLIYCLNTERDTRKIQNEIMPELLKNNQFRVTQHGIEEVEDDTMDDVLHPELSEQRMEKLEENIHKMMNMQRQGADIYFGGFSQMKRFPFFQTVSNWFLPYYQQHSEVSAVMKQGRGRAFLKKLMQHSPFCDSDKYSFVLGFNAAIDRIPDSLLSMLDRGEAAMVGTEVAAEELLSPAFFRRSYLQGLYRFYKVYSMRNMFVSPFEDSPLPRYVFAANPIFRDTAFEHRFNALVSFFISKKTYEAALLTLQNYRQELRDAQFYLYNGQVLMRTHGENNAGLTAVDSFRQLLALAPDNERGWTGYARALFNEGNYADAAHYYELLLQRHESNRSYMLNMAICLTYLKQYDEALKVLYKLNYEDADDATVNRVLAWTLAGAGKYEQADTIYQQLLNSGSDPAADDLLNYAYCCWFSGQKRQALAFFERYRTAVGDFDASEAFLATEATLLDEHGISATEIRLMIDALATRV